VKGSPNRYGANFSEKFAPVFYHYFSSFLSTYPHHIIYIIAKICYYMPMQYMHSQLNKICPRQGTNGVFAVASSAVWPLIFSREGFSI